MDASVTPTRTPMMGLRVLQEFPATEVSSGENQGARTPARPPKRFSFVIRSPECPVCGHAASNVSLHSLNDWRLCLAGSHQEPRSKSNCKQSFNILWCHRSCANSGLNYRFVKCIAVKETPSWQRTRTLFIPFRKNTKQVPARPRKCLKRCIKLKRLNLISSNYACCFSSSSGFEEESNTDNVIQKIDIAILGSKGVGKTQLVGYESLTIKLTCPTTMT